MTAPSCPICGAGPNAWCLERHVAEARDEIVAREAAILKSQNELTAECEQTDAFEKAALERTG